DVGVVGLAQRRLFVGREAIVCAPVPDGRSVPVNGLILVLASAAVVDVHVLVRWLTRRRHRAIARSAIRDQWALVLALLLERPANDLVVRAAKDTLRSPVELVDRHQLGGEVSRVVRVRRRREVLYRA